VGYPSQQTCQYDYDQYGNPSCRCGGAYYAPGVQSVGTSWNFCANNGMGVGDPCGGVAKRGTVFVECVTGYFPPVTQYYTYTYDQYGNVTSTTLNRTWMTRGWSN
jgi:YD repeat-containing protein